MQNQWGGHWQVRAGDDALGAARGEGWGKGEAELVYYSSESKLTVQGRSSLGEHMVVTARAELIQRPPEIDAPRADDDDICDFRRTA